MTLTLDEYLQADATTLAQLVQSQQIKSSELVELAQKRLEQVNPMINAVILRMDEQARDHASQNFGKKNVFAGVPFLLKDLIQAYSGVVMSGGSESMQNYTPQYNTEMVERFLKSGLVPIGKSNTPEFGLMGVTEPKSHGTTSNPWNTRHTAGGSSGGSAAAVASGIVPIAGAGDGGGSIRIPASCCGLVGLKATRGRFPMFPLGERWDGAVVEGVLTKSVRDTARALEAYQGGVLGESHVLPKLQNLESKLEKLPRKKLKIYVATQNPVDPNILDPEVKASVEQAAVELEKLGHHVESGNLPIDGAQAARSYLTMYFGQTAQNVDDVQRLVGPEKIRNIELPTKILQLLGHSVTAAAYVKAKNYWSKLSYDYNSLFDHYDLVLTPTLSLPPQAHGAFQPTVLEQQIMKTMLKLKAGKLVLKSGIVDGMAEKSLGKLPYTFITNLTGNPSISVPWGKNKDNLPMGLHFSAPHAQELKLLQVARLIEKMRPWNYSGLEVGKT